MEVRMELVEGVAIVGQDNVKTKGMSLDRQW